MHRLVLSTSGTSCSLMLPPPSLHMAVAPGARWQYPVCRQTRAVHPAPCAARNAAPNTPRRPSRRNARSRLAARFCGIRDSARSCELQHFLAQAFGGDFTVLFFDFDADGATAFVLCCFEGRPTAAKWVKDYVARLAPPAHKKTHVL